MLQQILQDMWVDPDILAELDEGQKQTLFCKMREEQVRRWVVWDMKVFESNKSNTNTTSTIIHTPRQSNKSNKPKKSVNFLTGVDGEPWVWVMGEHSEDKSIEAILEEEAREKARKLVEQELNTIDINEKNNINEKNEVKEESYHDSLDTFDIYCSVDELKAVKAKIKPLKNINNYSFNHYKTENIYSSVTNERDVLHEISLNKVQKVAQKVALWEKKMMEERIFKTIQKKHLEVAKEAEEAEHNQEALWREQELKAKRAEQQIREIARKAREEHRLACTNLDPADTSPSNPITTTTSTTSPPGVPTSSSPPPVSPPASISGSASTRPPSRDAVMEWYRHRELTRKAGLDGSGNLEPWFHGLITRQEAETLLMSQVTGTFLVRLSERIWGYTITYRAFDKCKHYLIDASNSHYQFLGSNQLNHSTLGDLIAYHKKQPLTGGECLDRPCPRLADSIAFRELISILDR